MKSVSLLSLGIAAAVFCTTNCLRAADPNETEKKLRETLRNTMLQLRSTETERATLQAAQTESEEKIKAQLAEIEALKKEKADLIKKAAAEKDLADKSIADLQGKVTDREKEAARLTESLSKWKAGYQKVADLARAKEDERAKKAAEVVLLERRVADQKMRNDEMYKVGSEILTRYQKYSLGEALLAKEPFTGVMRVKLQTLVQDYGDKLADQKIKVSDSKAGVVPKGASASAADKKAAPAGQPQTKDGSTAKPDQKAKS